MTLFDHVAAWLDHHAVRFAMIGAGALAVQRISGATLDQELLVTDRRVLNRAFWNPVPAAVDVEAHLTEADDVAGHVRLTASGERPVDIVVGRAPWLDRILDRRTVAAIPGRDLPVAAVADLIVLKLYAGGAEDVADIGSILADSDSASLREDVESRLSFLPTECALLWQHITASFLDGA